MFAFRQITLLLLLFSINHSCFSQTEQSLSINRDSFEKVIWKDTSINKEKLYWPTGKIKLYYEALNDSLRMRTEYFEDGKLKLKVVVYQKYLKTTSMAIKNGEFTSNSDSGYHDIFHGEYLRFLDSLQEVPIVRGNYSNNKQVGEWVYLIPNKNLVIVTFNDLGKLEGAYYEYYSSSPDDRTRIKWKGQFKNVAVNDPLPPGSPMAGVIDIIKDNLHNTKSIRSGTWEHFAEDGKILETKVYE